MSVVEDRAALRDLVEAYGRAIDRRDASLLVSLFTEDGALVFYEDGAPARERRGHDALAGIIDYVSRYSVTTHFIGNHTAWVDGDRATGETYCLAHHVSERDGEQRLVVMSIRYQDGYVRTGGAWKFERRDFLLDWQEDRPLRGER